MRNVDDYLSFVTVVESGGFSAAARKLNVSKSMLSRQIARLEQTLGTQLLFRTTRQLSPTDAGETLYRRCQNLQHMLEDVQQEVMELGAEPRGRLKLVAADTFGEYYVAPLAARFMRENPLLEVEVHITSRAVDLVSEGIDLAIKYGDMEDSSLLATKIFELPHVVTASPSYIQRHGKPVMVDDLVNHNCLVATFDACTVWQFETGTGSQKLKLRGSWCSNNGPSLLAACLEGLGISRLPELYVRPYIEAGELIPLLKQYHSPPQPVWAVYPNNPHIPAKVRLFINYLKENLSRETRLKRKRH